MVIYSKEKHITYEDLKIKQAYSEKYHDRPNIRLVLSFLKLCASSMLGGSFANHTRRVLILLMEGLPPVMEGNSEYTE
jgi:hypothetical protein